MRRAAVGVLLVLTACSSHGKASPDPSPTTPGGAVASILCRTHRVQIQADEQALLADQAAGDADASAALRVRIGAALDEARAIPGCDVQDLALP